MSKRKKPLIEVQLRSRPYEGDGLRQLTSRKPGGHSERAIAIKALTRHRPEEQDPFSEIVSLSETAGAAVVETVSQRIDRINSATYLGKGKISEVAQRVEELDVDFVVADNDLSPAQERNLENTFKRKVVDRSQLILDIFARRASTVQAKLQVELAQLRYTFPRLKRMWTHLERFEGGIGMRGPGETQLETDKRLIQRRIQKLQRKLDQIENRQKVTIRRRPSEFIIALVGYTNVGKSTLLNRLTGSNELVEDKLFATLDTRTRRWRVDRNRHVLLKDTVGFIRQLPHDLVASFHATLAETQHADLLFHVVDASSAQAEREMDAVKDVLRQIECDQKPTWLVLNKVDRVSKDRQVEVRRLASKATDDGTFFYCSGANGQGLKELEDAVREYRDRSNQRFSLLVPHQRGDLFAYVQRHGVITAQESRASGIEFEVEMDPKRVAKLRSLYPEGFIDANSDNEL